MAQEFTKQVAFKAVNDEDRTATGAVLVPDEVDRQRDFLRRGGVEAMFAEDPDDGVMHAAFPDGAADLVRSEIVDEPVELNGEEYPAGTWVATRQYADDDLWQLVKDGVLTGFSIGGRVEEVREYESADVPDDVTFPDDVPPGAATEIVDGSVEEVSDVDIPAVPRATYRELSKLGKSITEEVDGETEFVEVMRERGHKEDDARELWDYLQMHKDAPTEKPIILPNGAEFTDFDECVESVSGDGTSVEEAEAICGAGREQSKTETNTTNDMTQKADYSTGEWVTWPRLGGDSRGQVVEVIEEPGEGFSDAISGDVSVEAEEGNPVYLLEVWDDTGSDASARDDDAGRGDTMHVANREDRLRSVSDPRELEAGVSTTDERAESRAGQGDTKMDENIDDVDDATLGARIKSALGFGGAADDGANTSEDPDDAAKAGRTLSQTNRRAVMAAVDANLNLLNDAGVDHGMERFTDRADFAFDLAEYSGNASDSDDEMDKDAPAGETADDEMTDENTTDTEKESEPPAWAESLTEKVESIEKRVDEMDDDADTEKTLEDAPEWASALAEKVDGLDERVDKVSKATADTQQTGGAEETADDELSEAEKQKRELFFGGGN